VVDAPDGAPAPSERGGGGVGGEAVVADLERLDEAAQVKNANNV
jgi:hypothetical protein